MYMYMCCEIDSDDFVLWWVIDDIPGVVERSFPGCSLLTREPTWLWKPKCMDYQPIPSEGSTPRGVVLHHTHSGTRTTLYSRGLVLLEVQFSWPVTYFVLQILLPDLASVRLAVIDDDHVLVCQRVLPVHLIRSGFRHITMRDKYSNPLGTASLFVHIKIEDYVPDEMEG